MEFNNYRDGIQGEEIAPARVPGGNDAFQYALGVIDGERAIYRRPVTESGRYGGWRWEAFANRITG